MQKNCLKSLEIAMKSLGHHKIPLMGGGDWNDGMNLVGIKGKGGNFVRNIDSDDPVSPLYPCPITRPPLSYVSVQKEKDIYESQHNHRIF